MRAIIMATGEAPGIAPMNQRYPGPMLPLVDRPFIQHLVEYLAAQGITRFDFVLHHLPEKIEGHLGDGLRWGSQFTPHLVQDATRPYRRLKVLDFTNDASQPLLFGTADRLPEFSVAAALAAAAERQPLLFGTADGANPGQRRWTGWAIIRPEHLATVPRDADEEGFRAHLVKSAGGEPAWLDVPRLLDMSHFDRILEAHRAAMDVRMHLRVIAGEAADLGRTIPLPDEGQLDLGTLRWADAKVAASPCKLEIKEARVHVSPTDVPGAPGVNGRPVTRGPSPEDPVSKRGTPPKEPANDSLRPNDVLRVGATELRVELTHRFRGLFLGGREIETGIWLSRNVILHPTARVYPPVYVGENCTIGPAAKLGPNVVVGSDCLLDEKCIVSNAVIFPGSYVGEGVEVSNSLADKNRLVIVHIGEEVEIKENFILGSMSQKHLTPLLGLLVAWVLALVLLVLTAPLMLATALVLKVTRRGPVLHRRPVVRLPADKDKDKDATWPEYPLWSFLPPSASAETWAGEVVPCSLRGLLLGFLPALVNVVRGDLNLVGLPPRSRVATKGLAPDWQALYLRAKGGVVTEASVRFPEAPSEDEAYAADAFYVVTSSWKYDLRLLLRYFFHAVFGNLLPRRRTGAASLAPLLVEPAAAEEEPAAVS